MTFKHVQAVAAALCTLALAACAGSSQPFISNGQQGAPSGVTASNGGGQRALGNIPNIGMSQSGVTTGPVPAGRGNAY